MKGVSTESLSDKYMYIDSCGYQVLMGTENHMKTHSWFTYHILYITEGTGYVVMDGKRVAISAGNLIFYLPGQYREYDIYRNTRSRSYYVFFNGNACEDIVRGLKLDGCTIFNIGINLSISKQLDELINEFDSKNEHYEYMCHSYLLAILASVARNISAPPRAYSETRKRINEICKYIYENCDKIDSIGELAQICHLSESRFSHLFSELMGTSPKNYLLRARIETAKDMLANTDFSIGQISEALGLHDQNYFSRIFKRFTNMSPTEYRQNFLKSYPKTNRTD